QGTRGDGQADRDRTYRHRSAAPPHGHIGSDSQERSSHDQTAYGDPRAMITLRTYSGTAVVLSLLGCALADAAGGQNPERRVASAGDGLLQFNYPAREGVCGNGKTFIN